MGKVWDHASQALLCEVSWGLISLPVSLLSCKLKLIQGDSTLTQHRAQAVSQFLSQLLKEPNEVQIFNMHKMSANMYLFMKAVTIIFMEVICRIIGYCLAH